MPTLSERSPSILGLLGALLLLVAGAALARRWLDVVEVTGDSMSPTLQPGDWLVVERWSLPRRAPLPGEIVLAPDPRSPSRELIKRVSDVRDGSVMLQGDNPGFSTDSSTFGPVPIEAVIWRVVGRYWPPRPARRVPEPNG